MTAQHIIPAVDQWDGFVRQQVRAHVLQLSAWGTLKQTFGWKCKRVALAASDGQIIAGAQLLFRPLPLRLGTLAYLPMGPYTLDDADLPELWAAIDQTAKKHGARFLKWEPGIFLADEALPDFGTLGFKESPQDIQPPRTMLIDIRGSDDAILAQMNQGTRRKIRQGAKKGVRYYPGDAQNVAKFTAMMNTTGDRNDFGVHDPAYYEMAYDLFVKAGDATLIMAEHEGDPLAGIMVFALGKYAWYLYGASANVKRNLMATYGIQWEAIQWAKSRGCHYYDMWGIPDEDEATLEEQFQERSNGLWGVYGFKRGWGGDVVRAAGAWDKVYNPLVYRAYKYAIKLRD